MRGSIRRQVVLSTLISTVGLLAAMGVVIVFGLRFVLVRQLDRSLLEEARLVQAMVEIDEEGIQLDFEGLERGTGASAAPRAFLEVWGPDGAVLHRSRSLTGRDLLQVPGTEEEPGFEWTELEDAGRLRCVGFAFSPRVDPGEPGEEDEETAGEGEEEADGADEAAPEVPADGIRIALARTDDSVAEVLSGLLTLLGVCGLVLGAGAAALSIAVARSGLRPLRDFAARIAEIDDRSLSARLDVAHAPQEVAPVGERLNELLDRIEETLERERAFSADIAHELRTPLAGLRSTVEVALRAPQDSAGYRAALQDAREATERLQALVDRLLWLVRLDAGTVEIETRRTELGALLQETWNPLKREAEERGLSVEWETRGELWVVTDPMLAGIALRNLLENAVAYANEGGRVGVRLVQRGDRAAVEITNSGSRVRQEDIPGLLRRFTRGDQARTPVGSRCGLGLALVDQIAGALGHLVEIRSRPGGAFEVTLSMAQAG